VTDPVDAALRGAGAAVAAWGAVILAVYGVFITPLRVGTVLVPVALAFAVVGNLTLIWFAQQVTRNRWLALMPGGIWLIITIAASDRTTEGDLVLYQSNWVATAYLFAGAATITVAGYRIVTRRPAPAAVSPQDPDDPSRSARS
jgi:hypothetical protein